MTPGSASCCSPGSNCEQDAIEAVALPRRRRRAPVARRRDRRRRRRGRRARRLRPRRLPAARRHRPLLAGDGRRSPSSPRDGGPVVGHLQRLPGAHRGRAAARRAAEEPGPEVPLHHRRGAGRVDRARRSPPTARAGSVLRIPINHFEGNYTCSPETLGRAPGRGPDRAPLRRQPQRVGRRHRRHLQRGPQRGRPHAPPGAGHARPCSGPTDGIVVLRSLLSPRPRRPDRVPQPARPVSQPADAGLLQHLGGHTRLAPRAVGDALALAVALGRSTNVRSRSAGRLVCVHASSSFWRSIRSWTS